MGQLDKVQLANLFQLKPLPGGIAEKPGGDVEPEDLKEFVPQPEQNALQDSMAV